MKICSNCRKEIKGIPRKGNLIPKPEPFDPRIYEEYERNLLLAYPLLCEECAIKQMEEVIEERRKLETETKECKSCAMELPLIKFRPYTGGTARRPVCRKCESEQRHTRGIKQTQREGTRTTRKRARIHQRELGEMFGDAIPKDILERYPILESQFVESTYKSKEDLSEDYFEEVKNKFANVKSSVSKAFSDIKEEIEKEYGSLSKGIKDILDTPEVEQDIRDYVLKRIEEGRARRKILET